MTLVLSLWDDADSQMRWLDSTQPADSSPSTPGAARGPCPVTGGDVRQQHADAWVEYFNVKYGELDSTVNPTTAPTPPAPTPPAPTLPAPTPPAPTPPAPTPPTSAQPATCCWGGCGANASRCSEASSWCVESRGNCEGSCGGQWCPAPAPPTPAPPTSAPPTPAPPTPAPPTPAPAPPTSALPTPAPPTSAPPES